MPGNQVVWIDAERCTGCGRCVEACPVAAIALVDNQAQLDEKTCTGCGVCLEVCAAEAIQPLVEGELVEAERELVVAGERPIPTVERVHPLVQAGGSALAVAGVGLLAKVTRALGRAVISWLTEPSAARGTMRYRRPEALSRRGVWPSNGSGRRMRRRRRGG